MIRINRDSPLPLHYQVRECLLDEIEAGRLQPNQKIPPENELEELFGVSRTTVRQAVADLVNQGILIRKQGIGTFVAEPKLEYALGKLTSFTDDIRRRGQKPGSRLITLQSSPPTKSVARRLELGDGESAVEVVRLRFANKLPVGIHKHYLRMTPHYSVAELKITMMESEASLYKFLETKGLPLSEAHETLEAIPADDIEAGLLEVPCGAPLLLVSRTSYTIDKLPVEFCKMIYRADRYRYTVHLSR